MKKNIIFIIIILIIISVSCKTSKNFTNKDLLNAIIKNNKAMINKIIKTGINLNGPGAIDKTPLYIACMKGNYNTAQLLVDKGADVNILFNKEVCKKPLIMAAVSSGKIDFVKFLIKNGADVNAVNNKNRTALIIASCKGYADIARLLLENGADVNHEFKFAETTKTALIRAEEQGQKEVIKILKEYKAEK